MIFRFSLQHAVLGTMEISEPLGWETAKLMLTRHDEYHSLVEEFDISATFYGNNGIKNGGISFIKQVEQEYGVDAELRLIVEMSFDEGITYPLEFTGLLPLDEVDENTNNQLTLPVIPDDTWTKFLKRRDSSVNILSTTDFDDNPCTPAVDITGNLTSQIIPKTYEGILNDSFIIFESDWDPNDYIQITMDEDVLDEIDDVFTLPNSTNPSRPGPFLEPTEAGDYTFDLRIESSVIYYVASGTPPNCVSDRFITTTSAILEWYIQKNEETPIAFTKTDSPLVLTNRSTTYTYNGSLALVKGDVVRVYADITGAMSNGDVANFFIWSVNNEGVVKDILLNAVDCSAIGLFDRAIDLTLAPSTEPIPTYFNITGQTVFPQTAVEGFLLHDAFSSIIKRIIGDNIFYSEVLGSPFTLERAYSEEGCFWNYGLFKGLQLRQYSLAEKPFFQSFNQCWNGANPIFNLGLGIDTLNIVDIPELSDWLTTTGADYEWNIGIPNPYVALIGTGIGSSPDSEILYIDYDFEDGETYTITIFFEVVDVSGTILTQQGRLGIYNNSYVLQFSETESSPPDEGSITLTFIANNNCTKIGITFSAISISPASVTNIYITGVSATWTGEGQQVLRIEEKAHFYDQSGVSVYFDNVQNIQRGYDQEKIYNKISVGYKKWQSENISGIDDPQTKHEYVTRFKLVGQPIDLMSDFIAASLAIETTRRTTREKSADYKFDNDTFIIALTGSNTSPDGYEPELDENFDSVSNLFNSDTRYNLVLTPSRNLFRWANVLMGSLQQYLDSSFRFVSGEGNYDMISDYSCTLGRQCVGIICDPISEKQDIPFSDPDYHLNFGFLHLHYLYTITLEMTYERYKAIRDNRNLAIGISQTDSNHVKFFIKTLEYEIKKGEATITAWPVSYMDLEIIEQEFTMRCDPSGEDCENAITDELGLELTDELGICITFV